MTVSRRSGGQPSRYRVRCGGGSTPHVPIQPNTGFLVVVRLEEKRLKQSAIFLITMHAKTIPNPSSLTERRL